MAPFPGPPSALPTIPGNGVPYSVLDAVQRGATNKVPVIIGYTKDEGNRLPMVQTVQNYPPAALNAYFDLYFPTFSDTMKAQYNATRDGTLNAFARVISDSFFDCAIIEFANEWSKQGLDVYGYLWNITTTGSDPSWGIYHTADVPYVFQMVPPNQRDLNVSVATGNYWTSFARTGVPSSSSYGSIPWPKYTDTTMTQLEFRPVPLVMRTFREQTKCVVWDQFFDMFDADLSWPVKYLGIAPSPPSGTPTASTNPAVQPSVATGPTPSGSSALTGTPILVSPHVPTTCSPGSVMGFGLLLSLLSMF
jgi:carboxylesterase type B